MNDTPITPGGRSRLAQGIYIQNVPGYKKAIDNIVFNNPASESMPSLTPAIPPCSMSASSATSCSTTACSEPAPRQPDLLLGGDAVAISPSLRAT